MVPLVAIGVQSLPDAAIISKLIRSFETTQEAFGAPRPLEAPTFTVDIASRGVPHLDISEIDFHVHLFLV